jgi:hypothetical protein
MGVLIVIQFLIGLSLVRLSIKQTVSTQQLTLII